MILNVIRAYVDSDIPVLIWGHPGTGKTSSIMQLANEAGAHAEVLIGSTLDPIDVGGYLIPNVNGDVQQSPPPWARRIDEALRAGKPAWLVLDELSCAPPSVQAALLRVVQERRVGSLSIAGCRVIAASNPADTAADGGELSAATANRWAHVDWVVDTTAWVTGTLSAWGEGWTNTRQAGMAASVCAWISRSPQALLSVPTGAGVGRAWPSPRSWTAAIRAAGYGPSETTRQLVAGCVGDAAASEWHTYHVSRDLPDPEEVLQGRVEVPKRGDKAQATLAAMVAIVGRDEARINAAWVVLAGCRPDVALTAARVLLELSDGEVPDVARDLGNRLLRLK